MSARHSEMRVAIRVLSEEGKEDKLSVISIAALMSTVDRQNN